MASPLNIAFADLVATVHQCEESAGRDPSAETMKKIAERIADSAAEVLEVLVERGAARPDPLMALQVARLMREAFAGKPGPRVLPASISVLDPLMPLATAKQDVLSVAFALDNALHAPDHRAAQFANGRFSAAVGMALRTIGQLTKAAMVETFLVIDPDGTIREAQLGQSREAVVKDIAVGEYEASLVVRLDGLICEDVTAAVMRDVLDAIRDDRFGSSGFIPSLVAELFSEEAEAVRLSFLSPAEIRAERDDANADRAYEEMRDRMMEAAE